MKIKVLLVIKAEIIKYRKNNTKSLMVLFSLLIWPILEMLTIMYTYKPFNLENGALGFTTKIELVLFIITGLMGFSVFWGMIQNAWYMCIVERNNGVMGLMYLSPANRLAIVYGKALGAIIHDSWMLICFCLVIIFINVKIDIYYIFKIILAGVVILVSGVIWGGLLNSIFFVSRDVDMLVNYLEEPISVFTGTRVPINNFPILLKVISSIFALTYCLIIVRKLLLQQSSHICIDLLKLGAVLICMVFLTLIILIQAENYNRRTGNFDFY